MEGLIPYITEPRQDTGLTNGKIGIWLLPRLGGDAVRRVLRDATSCCASARSSWPHGSEIQNVPLGDAEHRRAHHLERHDGHGLGVAGCGTTSASSSCFIGTTVGARFLLSGDQDLRVPPQVRAPTCSRSTSNFIAIYFTMTGLHALHVICGMVVNGVLPVRRRPQLLGARQQRAAHQPGRELRPLLALRRPRVDLPLSDPVPPLRRRAGSRDGHSQSRSRHRQARSATYMVVFVDAVGADRGHRRRVVPAPRGTRGDRRSRWSSPPSRRRLVALFFMHLISERQVIFLDPRAARCLFFFVLLFVADADRPEPGRGSNPADRPRWGSRTSISSSSRWPIALCLTFGAWCVCDVPGSGAGRLPGGSGRRIVATAVGLVVYGSWFLEEDEGIAHAMTRLGRVARGTRGGPRGVVCRGHPRRPPARSASAIRTRPLTKGAEMGVWFLLGVMLLVQAGFGIFFFVYLRRRARGFRDPDAASGSARGQKGSRR